MRRPFALLRMTGKVKDMSRSFALLRMTPPLARGGASIEQESLDSCLRRNGPPFAKGGASGGLCERKGRICELLINRQLMYCF
jgi:hypothetical protein